MKRRSQTSSEYPSSGLLVSTFFQAASTAFRPLVSEPAAQWVCRVRELTQRGLELTTPEALRGFFFAECEFRLSDIAGEITYGDREVCINTTARAASQPQSYGLWEWANALGQAELVPHSTDFVFQLDRIEDIVHQMARATIKLRSEIARAAPSVVAIMDAARAKALADFADQQRAEQHRGTAARAASAFRQQRWERVVELLESIRDPLSRAEQEKLAYARKRAHQHRD